MFFERETGLITGKPSLQIQETNFYFEFFFFLPDSEKKRVALAVLVL